jgi:tetratricopeptide (TPR) repeat protein
VRGIGAGTFEFWWNQDEGDRFIRDAHSVYLEALAELGIPGLALVVILLGGLGALALRARPRLASTGQYGAHAGLGAAFVVYLVQAGVDWLWESTAITVLGLLVAAVAAAPRTRPLPAPRTLVRAGIAVVAVMACLLQVPGLVSTSLVRDSQGAIERGDVQAALGQANDAVEAQPWAASPYAHRALVEEEAGRLSAAAVDMRRAIDREPDNWRHPLLLARIEARRGRVASALQAYRRARRLRPESRFFQ